MISHHINTEVLDFSKPADATVEEVVRESHFANQLCLVHECNGVLTYANPLTGQKYAFCRSSGKENPVYLPNLSRILYSNRHLHQQMIPQNIDFETT
jgi:hypothetical protein